MVLNIDDVSRGGLNIDEDSLCLLRWSKTDAINKLRQTTVLALNLGSGNCPSLNCILWEKSEKNSCRVGNLDYKNLQKYTKIIEVFSAKWPFFQVHGGVIIFNVHLTEVKVWAVSIVVEGSLKVNVNNDDNKCCRNIDRLVQWISEWTRYTFRSIGWFFTACAVPGLFYLSHRTYSWCLGFTGGQ